MPVNFGTRTKQTVRHNHPEESNDTRTRSLDLGMSKRIAPTSLTFGSGNVSGPNGTFAAFAVNDPILMQGDGSVDGFYTMTAIDGANQSFLTLDPPPPTATTTVSIRTP